MRKSSESSLFIQLNHILTISDERIIQTKQSFVVVQSLSSVQLLATQWTVARQASLSSTISQSLLKFMSIEVMMSSNHLLLPSVFPSIMVCSSELTLCIRWPKHWNFSFSISPSNEYSGLISFRTDWFDNQ